MTSRARLTVPILLSIALFAFYALARHNARLIDELHLDRAATLRFLQFVAVIPLIFAAVRVLDLVAFDVLASRRGRVRTPQLLREIVSIALFVVFIGWAVWLIFETKVTGFLATGTVLAAILGLAMQETLGNLFAGIALHIEDSFHVGDVIRTGEILGIVEAIRWRGTRVRTFQNSVIVVPNSLLARERLEIFPRHNLNARLLQFNVDLSVPPARVIAVLTQAASNVEGVSREMPCFARVGGFGESSLTYEIKYFTDDYSQRDRIDADIRKAAWYALRRNGIPIPFPIRAVQRYAAPEQRHQPTATEIADRLATIDVLSPLSREALQSLAEASRVHVFSRGETIIRRGSAGDSMFIVHDGTVSVRIADDSKQAWSEVAQLDGGDFFGEMALLTGEIRTADVVALTDVVAVEIRKESLGPILRDHPDLAGAISARVASRRGTLDSIRSGAHADEHHSVLWRIRSFFGL